MRAFKDAKAEGGRLVKEADFEAEKNFKVKKLAFLLRFSLSVLEKPSLEHFILFGSNSENVVVPLGTIKTLSTSKHHCNE